MRKIFLIAIILTLSLQVVLFPKDIKKEGLIADTFILTGTINNEYPITMYLTINTNSEVTGKYYYDKVRKYIPINGKIKGSTIELEEKINDNITGKFSGKFDRKNIKYSGTWINTGSEKQMSFELNKNSIYKINHVQTFAYEYNYDNILLHEGTYIVLVNNGNLSIINNMNMEFIDEKNTVYNIAEYAKYAKDTEELYASFQFSSNYDFKYIDENIISIISYYWEYMGGAHGNGGNSTSIFNIRTGKLLDKNIDTLIIDNDDENLVTMIQEKLKEDYHEDEFFNFEQIRLNSNYYVDAEGLHFIYTTYEIAPYARGQVYLSFSFDELKPFVKRSSPFYYLFE